MLFTLSGKKSHIFARVGLTLALVLNLTLPAFASDLTSGSAFAVDERLLTSSRLALSSASAPVGSSTDPYYVKPFTNGNASMYRYTWSSTNPNGSTSGINVTFTNFADIVTHITNSIAQSVFGLAQRLHYDNDAIYGRLYDILRAIQHSSGDLGTFIPYFMPSSDFDFSSNDWTSYYRRNFDTDLKYTYTAKSSQSLAVQFKDFMFDNLWNQARTMQNLFGYVLGSDYSDIPSHQYYNQQTGGSVVLPKRSLWADLRVFIRQATWTGYRLTGDPSGTNYLYKYDNTSEVVANTLTVKQYLYKLGGTITNSLGRLAYVLANDDDIALRQTQHDNMQTVKDDFTSGDVSVTPAKLGGLKSVGSALTDGFSSSASVSDGLSVLGSNSDAWAWFSDENAQAFDSVSGTRNSMLMLKSGTGYLDQYYKDVIPYVN